VNTTQGPSKEDQLLKTFRSYLEAVGHVTNLKEALFHMKHLGTNPVPFYYPNLMEATPSK